MKLQGLATRFKVGSLIGLACSTVLVQIPTAEAAETASAIGSYYSAQYTNWPPLPANFLNLPAVQIGDSAFLLDDLNVNYVELNQQAELLSQAERALGLTAPGIDTQFGAGPFVLSSCFVGLLTPTYQVTNVILILTNTDANGVYDIFTVSNLSPNRITLPLALTTLTAISSATPSRSFRQKQTRKIPIQITTGDLIQKNSVRQPTL